MLLHIPDVLTEAEVRHCRGVLEAAEWVDGGATAGFQSARVKNNAQLARALARRASSASSCSPR